MNLVRDFFEIEGIQLEGGAAVYSSTAAPTSAVDARGEAYPAGSICIVTTGGVWQIFSDEWMPLTSIKPSRKAVNQSEYAVSNTDAYLGVVYVNECVITLNPANPNKLIIKNEKDTATSITVSAPSGYTIDGQTNVVLQQARACLKVVLYGTNWNIV